MKRFHVHVSVGDLAESVRFYSQLFGAEPSVHKSDYAKWLLEDPRVNFAISQRGAAPGVQHVGIQVETFLSTGESTVYGRDPARFQPAPGSQDSACCAPSCCSPRAA